MASAYSTVILLLAAIGFGLLKLSGWLAEWVRGAAGGQGSMFYQ